MPAHRNGPVSSNVRLHNLKHLAALSVNSDSGILTSFNIYSFLHIQNLEKGRSWRHLDFLQYEAWMHAQVPRVGCAACGKATWRRYLAWHRRPSHAGIAATTHPCTAAWPPAWAAATSAAGLTLTGNLGAARLLHEGLRTPGVGEAPEKGLYKITVLSSYCEMNSLNTMISTTCGVAHLKFSALGSYLIGQDWELTNFPDCVTLVFRQKCLGGRVPRRRRAATHICYMN